MKWIVVATLSLWICVASAGNDHTMAQIDTCYHWLTPAQLASKVDYAEKNNGALLFFGGSAVYCWRSPLGAYSSWEDHGSELIRIKLKSGIRVVNKERDPFISHMVATPIIYSNDTPWHEYTIAPGAVESWSMYEPNMVQEMRAELQYYRAGLATADDVFYPFRFYDLNYAVSALTPIIQDHAAQAKKAKIYGPHPENHFKTSYILPWMKFLKRDKDMSIVPLPEIKIVEASYGLNLDKKNKGNATTKAGAFCNKQQICQYKVSPKFIDDPSPKEDKSFEIAWVCSGKAGAIQRKKIDSPADDKVFELSCIE
jgi:hypothetical protein